MCPETESNCRHGDFQSSSNRSESRQIAQLDGGGGGYVDQNCADDAEAALADALTALADDILARPRLLEWWE